MPRRATTEEIPKVGGHPCPNCWTALVPLWDIAAYKCEVCGTIGYEALRRRELAVEVFDQHVRFSAVISALFLLLTGNMKGTVGKGSPHEGKQWQRTHLKDWMDGK